MSDRELDAIRTLVTLMRSDMATVHKLLAAMLTQGFTAEETQAAVNEVAKRACD